MKKTIKRTTTFNPIKSINNSLFYIDFDLDFISNVRDKNNVEYKYEYNINSKCLTVFANLDEVIIDYITKNKF